MTRDEWLETRGALLCFVVLAAMWVVIWLCAKRSEGQQILSPAELASIRAALPQIEGDEDAAEANRILHGDEAIWYTRAALGVVHQKGSGLTTNGRTMGFALSNVNTALDSDQPDGRFPHGVGGNPNVEGAFPWSQHAGGAHASPGVGDWKLMYLPRQADGTPWPVVMFRREIDPFDRRRGDPRQVAWDWVFPDGTTFLEVIHDRGVPFEIRRRTLRGDSWDVDAYVPYPTARELSVAIQEEEPDWRYSRRLVALVEHLESDRPLMQDRLRDTNRDRRAFDDTAWLDPLPSVGDDDLVRRLMRRPFKSRAGETWRKDASGNESVAPTVATPLPVKHILDSQIGAMLTRRDDLHRLAAAEPRHVVPIGWAGGHIAVDSMSCARCHESGLKSAAHFDRARGWYSRVRGDWAEKYDGGAILSWHPVDATRLPRGGQKVDNPPIRAEWAGIVQMFPTVAEAERAVPADRYDVKRGLRR